MKLQNTINTIIALSTLLSCLIIISCEAEDTNETEYPIVPGKYELSLDMDSITRWFTLVIPDGYNPDQESLLVLAFHPGNANMAEFINAFKGFIDLAAEKKWPKYG